MRTSRSTSPRPVIRRLSAAVLGALCVAAAGLALWAPAAGAATTSTMVIEGRGWGHGIGLCQYGAYGYALHGWSYGNIIRHYYTGVKLGKVANVPIRVLLRDDAASAVVTDAAKYKASWGSTTVTIGAGVTATVTWTGSSYRLTAGSKTWTPGAPVTFTPGSSRLKLVTANDNGYVGHYRGTLRIVHMTSGLAIVNKLPIESYLRGVVPRESPASWPLAALEAQAVAARSYAYVSRGGAYYDVRCTTADQMYGGADGEAAGSNTAVTKTAGIVPKYHGAPIWAFFFSTSGGHTENIEDSWTSAAPVPYLKGVPDPYDSYSPYDKWPDNPIKRTPASIAAALGFSKGPLRAVSVVKRGTSPRVITALLIGDKGSAVTSGALLQVGLGLRDKWMYFTSLAITPPSGVVTYGTKITLGGRLYPALASGKVAKLHQEPAGGSWKTSSVAGKVLSATIDGYTVRHSDLSVRLKPACTTRYYFSATTAMAHTAASAIVTISVKPAVTIAPATTTVATGATVTFTGSVLPVAAAGTVWLQAKPEGTTAWVNAVKITVGADGSYSASWTAVAGTTALRISVPASAKFAAGTSPTATVTAS